MYLSFTPYARMIFRANFQETWGKQKGTVWYFFVLPKLVGNKMCTVSVPRQILLVYCIVLKFFFSVLCCYSGENPSACMTITTILWGKFGWCIFKLLIWKCWLHKQEFNRLFSAPSMCLYINHKYFMRHKRDIWYYPFLYQTCTMYHIYTQIQLHSKNL
jgi:hypothetical protein